MSCEEDSAVGLRLAVGVFEGAQWYVERPSGTEIVVHYPSGLQAARGSVARLSPAPAEGEACVVESVSASGDASAAFVTLSCSRPVEHRVTADGSAGTFALVLMGARLGQAAAREIILPPGPVSRVSAKASSEGVRVILGIEGRARCEVVRNLKGNGTMIKVEAASRPEEAPPVRTLPLQAVAARAPVMFFAAEETALPVPTVLAPLNPVVTAQPRSETRAPAPALVSAAPEEVAPPAPTVFAAAPVVESRLVNVDFVNADLVDVFKILAYQSGKDIAVDGSVTGTITLKLTEVPLEQALDLVCRLNNLSYTEIGKSYVVGPKEKIAAIGGATSEIYRLQVVPVDQAAKLVQVIAPTLTVIPQKETSSLVLVGSREDVARARGFLNALERSTGAPGAGPEVAPEATEVVKVENVSPEDAASFLTDSVAGLSARPQAKLGMVTLSGSRQAVDQALVLLKQVDVPVTSTQAVKVQNQPLEKVKTLVEDTFPALNVEAHTDLGILVITGPKLQVDEAVRLVSKVDVAAVGPGAGPAAGLVTEVLEVKYVSNKTVEAALGKFAGLSVAAPAMEDKGARRLLIVGPANQVAAAKAAVALIDVAPRQVMIEAMVTDMSSDDLDETGVTWDLGSLEVLETRTQTGMKFGTFTRTGLDFLGVIRAAVTRGSSKILAQPRILALDGETASVLSGQRIMIQTQQIVAGAVTTTIQEIRVGVELEITPRITADGYIICNVKPQVSNIGGYTPQQLPIIVTREASSTARVADGQTLIVGGLMKEEEVRNLTRVPYISEIPILGELFKRRQVTRRPSELVIFITPKIVSGEGGNL